MHVLTEILTTHHLGGTLPWPELITLLSSQHEHHIFIKNRHQYFEFSNQRHLNIFGMTSNNQIKGRSDSELCSNKDLVKRYKEFDVEVFDTKMPLKVSEVVNPKNNPSFIKEMQGTIYPLFNKKNMPILTLGIVHPVFKLEKINLDIILSLLPEELNALLTKQRYLVKIDNLSVTISRREIQCLIEILKGNHAGNIATILQLKQTTIESYISHLKNKLGASSRQELISTILQYKVLTTLFYEL